MTNTIEVKYGVFRTDEPNPFFYTLNDLYKTSIGLMNGLIVKRNLASCQGDRFQYQKKKWVHKVVWERLPKQKPQKLQDKIKEKFNEKRSLKVKLVNLNVELTLN